MREVLAFLNRNKTKLTGAFIASLGALQANEVLLKELVTPRQFAWLMLGAGILVSFLGFLNNPER